jgi:pimeloyl-ACP methyl ester carboxylesterase
MKWKLVRCLYHSLFVVLLNLASVAHADLNTGLVAYYPFSGNANDASGNGNNGVVFNATLTTDRFGNANSAYSFANAAYIGLGSPTYLQFTTQDFSVCSWALFNSGGGLNPRIISYCGDCGYELLTLGTNWERTIGCKIGSSFSLWSSSMYPTGVWYHVAATRHGTQILLYINGVLSAQDTATLNLSYPSNYDLRIGMKGNPLHDWWAGEIDDVRVYNRALSASEIQQLYTLPISPPTITTSPQSLTTNASANVVFSVTATSLAPMSYQWFFNGQNIVGATNATLTLNSVGATNSGGYMVVVSNAAGSVTSATAYLAVLTDGANGNQPTQLSCAAAPSPQPSQDSLVLVTHGYIPPWDTPVLPSWVTNLTSAIQASAPANWEVAPVDWSMDAWMSGEPETALYVGAIAGALLGQQLKKQTWQRVHLIGHSAGAALIQAVANELKTAANPPVIQVTLLDPFVGLRREKRDAYGANANWADCYFTQDWLTGGDTGGNIPHAYNVDVDWTDPNCQKVNYGSGQVAFSTHEWSHDFYIKTVTNTDAGWCGASYGFRLSAEGGGQANQGSHPVGNGSNPTVPCGLPGAIPSPNPYVWLAGIAVGDVAHAYSSGVALFSTTFTLTVSSLASQVGNVKSDAMNALVCSDASTSNSAAWLAVGVTVTSAINFVQFDAGFADTNSAQGLLTVYWNTNQVGMVDERVASGLQTYQFALPATVTTGVYTLSFRLDAFNSTSSSIVVTNVATGYVGANQPVTLGISAGANGLPVLQLNGASNFNYYIECSTNLVDWTPCAVLVNSNGVAQFIDSGTTNFNQRFYRAMVPK